MEPLTIWIFSVIIGCLIGIAKDRFGSGLLWSLLFGPVGCIVVLCLPNLKKEKEDTQRNKLLQAQLELQRAQLQQLQQMQTRMDAPPRPPRQYREPSYHVARNGEDLGSMSVTKIKLMLSNGEMSLKDYYFDKDAKEWLPLDCLPDVV